MTLSDLMAVSRERELTDAEQSRVVTLAWRQRWWASNRERLNAARRRPRSKSDVARMKARDEAGRFA